MHVRMHTCQLSVDRFSCFCKADATCFLYLSMAKLSPQNCWFLLGIRAPSNTWFIRPSPLTIKNRISTASAISEGPPSSPSYRQTNRHTTTHATQSAAIIRCHCYAN